MNTEKREKRNLAWFLPLLLALPFLAGIIAAAAIWGPTLMRVISVLIKTAVEA